MFGQYSLCITALRYSFVQFSPSHTLVTEPGCSFGFPSGGMSQDTAGSSPFRMSSRNVWGGWTFCHSGPKRTCLTAWSAFIHASAFA